jgi:rubredoxin
MTKREAKELSLLVWEYLAAHPDQRKENLPKKIFNKVKEFAHYCPLCEYMNQEKLDCANCALGNCDIAESAFHKWTFAASELDRQAAAQEIVDKIKAWEVEE